MDDRCNFDNILHSGSPNFISLDFLFYQGGNKDRDFRAGVAHEKNWERGDFI